MAKKAKKAGPRYKFATGLWRVPAASQNQPGAGGRSAASTVAEIRRLHLSSKFSHGHDPYPGHDDPGAGTKLPQRSGNFSPLPTIYPVDYFLKAR